MAGVLDDPALTDGMIEAVVAHEMGHWADPESATSIRRSVIVTFSCAGLGVLGAIGIAVGTNVVNNGTLMLMFLAIVVGFGCSLALSPIMQWKDEYFADRFAAEATSADTVISLMRHFQAQETRSLAIEHPSRARRIRRIEVDALTESAPPTAY
ncbi:hypothetical protein BH686_04325 [Rhodococcus erythropolis]|nr:hypothetical protein BH686_04325 [Rhodococcus erythropolis]